MKCRERRSNPVADRGHDDLILPAKCGGVNMGANSYASHALYIYDLAASEDSLKTLTGDL